MNLRGTHERELSDTSSWLQAAAGRSVHAIAQIESGDAEAGLAQLRDLVRDCRTQFGAAHPQTLRTGTNYASWLGQLGDPSGARQRLVQLRDLAGNTLGPLHPDTLRIANNAAAFAGLAGLTEVAAAELSELVPKFASVFGSTSPETERARTNLGAWRATLESAEGLVN